MNFAGELKGPWLHVVVIDLPSLADRLLRLVAEDRYIAVRIVRGTKMKTEMQLFDEFAAALQFPYYFGENWDALNECINDLSWMPAERFVLVITNAAEALAETTDAFRTLMEILCDAGREWSKASPGTRPWAPEPRPFHVILQVSEGGMSGILSVLDAAGVEHTVSFREA